MTAAAIFVGEVIVMFVLSAIPPLPVVAEAFVDGLMITALMVPFLYLLLYKPMAAEIDRRRAAQRDLRDLNRELEQRVDERTRDLLQANERLKREISEKKQARDEVWKDHEFVRSVVEAMPCLLVIYDVGARRCVFANSQVVNLLGYASEEIFESGRNFLETILSEEDYSKLTKELLDPANQELSTRDLGELRLRMRSGECKSMAARYAVLRSDPRGQGEVILFGAIEVGS